VNVAYRTVGKALPRIEGFGKVTGQTKYAADLPCEGAQSDSARTRQKHRHVQGKGIGRRSRRAAFENGIGREPHRSDALRRQTIAENPNVPTAAAIANAVADACGVRIFDLPITAGKVYWALRRKPE
jgi:CO/xanthine dehydrogenase Mo-binding subunit